MKYSSKSKATDSQDFSRWRRRLCRLTSFTLTLTNLWTCAGLLHQNYTTKWFSKPNFYTCIQFLCILLPGSVQLLVQLNEILIQVCVLFSFEKYFRQVRQYIYLYYLYYLYYYHGSNIKLPKLISLVQLWPSLMSNNALKKVNVYYWPDPLQKGHLDKKTTFAWSHGWSSYRGLTVHLFNSVLSSSFNISSN